MLHDVTIDVMNIHYPNFIYLCLKSAMTWDNSLDF